MDEPAKTYSKIGIAYSGGLDSSLAIEIARRKYKAKEIVAVCADVGQGADEVQVARDKAKVLKIDPIFVDARKEFTEDWLVKAIRANSDYEGIHGPVEANIQHVAEGGAEWSPRSSW
jgi:argininosuccinate synthase